MEVEQLEYQGTLTSTPHAQFDVMPNPEATPARADRDWRLVRALRLREPTAADRLVATYGDRSYRLAVRITGNEQDAEEAVQDAFWSVVRKIDTFRGDSAFGSWVYRIVSNDAYEKIRRRPQAFVDISLDEVLPPFNEDGRHAGVLRDWSSSLDDPAVQTELRGVLSSAVSELPAHYRAVMVLYDVEGLSMAEVADVLGITVPTAKTRAHRARLLLRKRLSAFMASAGASVEDVARRNTREEQALQRDGRHSHLKGDG
jgi:RNA polymerase sigma-70 factor, ECF subfamily